MMNCEQAQEKLMDGLTQQLSPADQSALEAHMASCPACQTELAATRQLWQSMKTLPVPEPSEKLRIHFYAMLETYQEAEEMKRRRSWKSLVRRFRRFWTPELAFRLAYSLVLVALGVGGGYWLSDRKAPAQQQQINELSNQVKDLRQTVLLSLLENTSATERLRAVEYTNEMGHANEQVITALLSTLNNDPNVNVRLVTLEALAKLAGNPAVREGLVQSIVQQDSPLMQVALADVMVKLQEKRSIQPLRQLLRQENLNDLVKVKIQQTLKDLS